MMTMTDLENDINSLREQLYFLLLSKKTTDSEVLIFSEKLDKLLVEYEKSTSLVSIGNKR